MSEVQLWVYDLSNGMARQLSMAFLNRQIDAIYHTSVVVFGTEYFFGQGICECAPGQSHHGQPMQVVSMGTTHLPFDIFVDYLTELSQVYTPQRYHLLDNNCNHFTNDLCQFLVGKSIPSHISSLPNDFLGTPLGQQLRPMIDAMFQPTGTATQFRPNRPSAPVLQPLSASTAVSAISTQLQQHPITFTQGSLSTVINKLRSYSLTSTAHLSDFENGMLTKDTFRHLDGVLKQLKQDSPWFPIFDIARLLLQQNPTDFLRILSSSDSNAMATLTSWTKLLASHTTPQSILTSHITLLRFYASLLAQLVDLKQHPSTHLCALISELIVSNLNMAPLKNYDRRASEALSALLFNLSLMISLHDGSSPPALIMDDDQLLELGSALFHFLTQFKPFMTAKSDNKMVWANATTWADKDFIIFLRATETLVMSKSGGEGQLSDLASVYGDQMRDAWQMKVGGGEDGVSEEYRLVHKVCREFITKHASSDK